MNNFIFTAIVVLAASKSKVQNKDNETNKERKDNSDGEKVLARKASWRTTAMFKHYSWQ
jgi:hypothetical protein